MDIQEIEYAKEKYNLKLREQNKINFVQGRVNELEKTKEVKEYLKLVEFLKGNNKKYNEQDMLYDSFSEVSNTTVCSNDVLVYMGAYKINNLLALVLCDENEANFICYEDLETEKLYKIKPINKKIFEEEHNVVYLDDKNYNEGIKKLRINFFKQLLDTPQEEVVKKLIKGK